MAYVPCRFLGTNGKRRIRKDDMFACSIEVEEPKLPSSITKSYLYVWPHHRAYVGKDDCAKCPFYEKKEGAL